MTKATTAAATSLLSEATARPWHIYRGRDLDKVWQKNITVASYVDGEESGDVAIAQCHFNTRERSEANAALIVRAVNSHDDLVSALHAVYSRVPGNLSADLGWVEALLSDNGKPYRAALAGAK